jgi:hypothetical protein
MITREETRVVKKRANKRWTIKQKRKKGKERENGRK